MQQDAQEFMIFLLNKSVHFYMSNKKCVAESPYVRLSDLIKEAQKQSNTHKQGHYNTGR